MLKFTQKVKGKGIKELQKLSKQRELFNLSKSLNNKAGGLLRHQARFYSTGGESDSGDQVFQHGKNPKWELAKIKDSNLNATAFSGGAHGSWTGFEATGNLAKIGKTWKTKTGEIEGAVEKFRGKISSGGLSTEGDISSPGFRLDPYYLSGLFKHKTATGGSFKGSLEGSPLGFGPLSLITGFPLPYLKFALAHENAEREWMVQSKPPFVKYVKKYQPTSKPSSEPSSEPISSGSPVSKRDDISEKERQNEFFATKEKEEIERIKDAYGDR